MENSTDKVWRELTISGLDLIFTHFAARITSVIFGVKPMLTQDPRTGTKVPSARVQDRMYASSDFYALREYLKSRKVRGRGNRACNESLLKKKKNVRTW